MADLRIVDAPVLLQESITDDVKMPTGGLGNFSIRLGDLVWYVVAKENLASKSYVDTSSQGVQDKLNIHVADKNNPHQVTKAQVGLGNVDNTADTDKPVSNATKSAIITATTDMATKTYVNSKDGDLTTLKTADKTNLVKAVNEIHDVTKGVVALYDKNVKAGAGANGWDDTLIAVSENINQRQINDGLESIAQLLAIKNPRNGQRVYVKSYHAGYKRGGGWFTFDSSKVSFQNYLGQTITNDKGLYINGWVRDVPNNEVTPEMFGAYGEASSLGFDDYQAIEDMFHALVPCVKGTKENPVSLNDAINPWIYSKHHVVRLDSLYKHSQTIFIPPNIRLVQSNRHSHWSRNATKGFWYSPAEGKRDSFAVGNYIYSKINVNNTDNNAKNWYLNTDVHYVPKFSEEANTYYALWFNQELENLTIITDTDVTLGLRLIGTHMIGTNVTIGGFLKSHSYANQYSPKVGMLAVDTYVSNFKDLRVRADIQGVVVVGSQASTVFDHPWIVHTARKLKTSDLVPIYKSDDYTVTGCIAITVIDSDPHFHCPTYEQWNVGVVAIWTKQVRVGNTAVSLYRPHCESLIMKHEYYLLDSSINVEFKNNLGSITTLGGDEKTVFKDKDGSIVTYPDYSIFYFKNCGVERTARISGTVYYSFGTLFKRENSVDGIVHWDAIFNSNLFQKYGLIGDVKLIGSCNWANQGMDVVYVDAVNGSDTNAGFGIEKPIKTLSNLKNYVDIVGIKYVSFRTNYTMQADVVMPNNSVEFGGSNVTIDMQTFKFIFKDNFNAKFTDVLTLTKQHPTELFFIEYERSGRLVIKSNINAPNSTLVIGKKGCDIDLVINNTTLNVSRYLLGYHPYFTAGISVVTSSAIPANSVYSATVLLKYKSPNVTVSV